VLNLIRKDAYALARMDLVYKKLCKFTPLLSAQLIFKAGHFYSKYILNSECFLKF
jgi:hypothetical protein